MNRTRRFHSAHSVLLALFGVTMFVTGCADDTIGPAADVDVSGDQTLETADLDQAYGGLSFTDEDEAFGDDALLAAMVSEEAAALSEDDEDSLSDDDPSLRAPQIRRTFVRILWGQLDGEFDPEADRSSVELLDWSGSVKVSEGVVALKRTILFERPSDHRLPRVSRDSLAWKSATGPHFDGVLVCVLSRLDDEDLGQLVFETPQYDVTLDIADLDGFEQVVAVDENGNAVSIQAQVQDQVRCAAGFVSGFWKSIEDRPETEAIEMGGFRGRYVGQNGVTTGFLMGFYGLDSEGQRVMVGKFIGRDGRIQGLIAGTWIPESDGMGMFQARWVNRSGKHLGTLQGRYIENGEREIGDGFFGGRYREICSSVD